MNICEHEVHEEELWGESMVKYALKVVIFKVVKKWSSFLQKYKKVHWK